MATLSVVVVNWNAGPALMECLASVFVSQPWGSPPEVWVVDNASTDGSAVRAAAGFPAIAVIRNADNRGFARAANQALVQARGEFVLLLNPDVVLAPTALVDLLDALVRRPDVAVVGPRLVNPDGSVQGSARRDPSVWTGLFGRRGLLTRFLPGNAVSRRELPALVHEGVEPIEVDWVSGACLVARRSAWQRIGLLDERFFLFWEDADWCRRFRQGGWKVCYVPQARAMHRVGVSRARRAVRSTLDFHVSAYRYYRKHNLTSPMHPAYALLVMGLLTHLGLDLGRLLIGPRGAPRSDPGPGRPWAPAERPAAAGSNLDRPRCRR
jgi:GT2 family glycosyltransferase